MALVDFVADAQLTVFVVAHAVDLSLGSEEQSIEYSTLNLLDLVAEIDQEGSCYFLWFIHSQLSVFI